jgi:hypothetical protein
MPAVRVRVGSFQEWGQAAAGRWPHLHTLRARKKGQLDCGTVCARVDWSTEGDQNATEQS